MKIRYPLSAQILTFLALHLAVLLALVFVFFNAQFGAGWEPFVYSPLGERVDSISWVIGRQIQGLPEKQWNSVLDVFGKFYGVRFCIFDARGHQLAGQAVALPQPVLERITMRPRPGGDRPANLAQLANPDKLVRNRPPRRWGRFLLHTDNPDCFWIGTRLHLHGPPCAAAADVQALKWVPPSAPPAEKPVSLSSAPLNVPADAPRLLPLRELPPTLLAVSTNLWQTKLFFDLGLLSAAAVAFLLLSVIIWWPFIYRLNRALSQLTAATEKIAEGKFDTTLQLGSFDEIGRLSEAINRMSHRLQGFVNGQKRFLGDIAHELCSPVARLQVALELLERSASRNQDEAIKDIREEAEEMSALINELLAFSKAGLRGKETQLKTIELKTVIEAAIGRAIQPALVQLDMPEHLPAMGDEVLIERAIANILRNCARYAADGGPIKIRATRSGTQAVITIADCGPGVPDEALEMLGEPFYRPESSRSRSSGGVGLGLAIVKTCVEACDGSFKVRNMEPHGLEVEIRLQAAPALQPSAPATKTPE